MAREDVYLRYVEHVTRKPVSIFRSVILENAVSLELRMDLAIATGLSRDRTAALILLPSLERLPITMRMAMLDQLLRASELSDRWPFVVPILKRVYELRDAIAHSTAVVDQDGEGMTLHSVRRGTRASKHLKRTYVEWLAYQSDQCGRELAT